MNARQWVGVAVVIVAVVGAYLLGSSRREGVYAPPTNESEFVSPPALESFVGFDPLEMDLGRQPWHSEIPFTATFANQTAQAVTIAAVRSPCGCMGLDRVAYTNRLVEPGTTMELDGVLEVGGRLGEQSVEIQVLLTTGAMHTAFLTYEGFATYTYSPESVSFEEVDLDDEASGQVKTVVFVSETAAIVGEPRTDARWLNAGVYEHESGQTEIALHVDKTCLPHGENVGRAFITTDDPWRPEFSLTVRATGVAALRPVPAHVFVRRGTKVSVRFVGRDGDSAPIMRINAESDTLRLGGSPDGLTVTVSVTADGGPRTSAVWVTDAKDRKTRFLVSVID
ncbi:MAG: DUF1573 domain-containing protein [Planctomycetes bacterium]|nr:DUF1573 domain-containing protein [Planctomycetota bacterium]